LYVTHSTEELASLADTLVLLNVGHVVAAGPLAEIITRSDLPLALRDDFGTVLTATIVEHDQTRQLTALQASSVRLWVSLLDRELGTQVRVRVPAREVILAAGDPGPTSAHNVMVGPIRAIAQDENKNTALVEIGLGGNATLLARVTRDAIERVGLAVGRNAAALVKSMSVQILPG
jgi:molybdate transport system ATP-binding protein